MLGLWLEQAKRHNDLPGLPRLANRHGLDLGGVLAEKDSLDLLSRDAEINRPLHPGGASDANPRAVLY
jgi:hypothetical protein